MLDNAKRLDLIKAKWASLTDGQRKIFLNSIHAFPPRLDLRKVLDSVAFEEKREGKDGKE